METNESFCLESENIQELDTRSDVIEEVINKSEDNQISDPKHNSNEVKNCLKFRSVSINSSNNKSYNCEYIGCQKSYKTVNQLTTHLWETHTKQFKCNEKDCNKTFITEVSYKE